jgi:hypothetical protein
MRQEATGGPALELLEFVAESRRGICALAMKMRGQEDDADD